MNVALAQLDFHIGHFEQNTRKILDAIHQAQLAGAELIVFPELCITGYPPRDFLEFTDFLDRVHLAIKQVAKACTTIHALVGAPSVNPELSGKNLFNSAYLLGDGKVKQVINKTLLPTYDVFDEYRYFEPNKTFECVEINGKKIAVVICEDTWDIADDPMYTVHPLDELMKENPECIINLSASPFSYTHHRKRMDMLRWNTQKYKLPMVYVNHVGAQTELIFDGGSMVFNASGECCERLPFFKEEVRIINIKHLEAKKPVNDPTEVSLIHDALVLGIRDYFHKLGFKKAILGLSGGIDSAVTCALAVEALGKEQVWGVMMPSPYSSQHSIEDAVQLAKNLGIRHDVISISNFYHSFLQGLQPLFEGKPFDVTEENIQARCRAVTLMALSNKFGHILLNTSNKSEAAVGYGTLYGDMCGGLSVLGDIYKTQVYELANYINRNQEVIPMHTIVKPPSAELRENQKDSDSLPEYDILDKILFQYIEMRKGPLELKKMGFDSMLVDRVLKLVNMNEYKRHQTPPILRVSDKAFGMGRRMPIVAKYLQ
ncbi:MAG: NAD+ synthase [Flavobacteriales bacterium]|nr:NAD+ synthase [Flavobacteriales bacterium]